ncbi:hypothetical protein OV203_19515 [Nannocystis sp. ILAH1]|uniref:hypothetical protein n=1 Tax=unclassified Nannocystis TaxID=2627009 RepID=UPI00227051C9|nr:MULTISPECIES: hypothetical protein [unclassified Nannocystis]MCY0989337.1 hypothetical protein [Nannocystis sp. ILAH1]MCY1064968.1 hypothetical protein [Nannocystis sp. RBIL2]
MKNLSSISLALLAGALTFGACDTEPTPDGELIAEESDSDALTPAALGFGDEWVAVEPGLWASWDELGNKKFLGLGEAGKAHAIASLISVAEELESNLSVKDSDDARAKLAELHDYITDIQASSSGEAAADELEFRCSFDISGFVDAHPVACGAAAVASASFSHPCGSQKAYVKTFASASCEYDTKTHTCGPLRGDPVSCSSFVSDTGNAPCSSYAIAQIYDAPGVNVYLYDHNSQRGACGTPTTSGSTSFNPTGGGGCNGLYVQCDPL